MGNTLGGVGVLDKAIVLLDALEQAPCSLSELVAITGLPRATAHRLATALETHGLVRRDDEGRFTLGSRLVALGRAAAEAFPLAGAAHKALRELRDLTEESVQLFVPEADRRVCIAVLQSPHGLRTIVPLGASLSLNELGSGARVLNGELGAGGWIESVGEREAGVASVSAPVLDRGVIIAAVSVSGPIERTTKHPGRRYGEAVVVAARRIERDAGLRTENS